MLILLWRSGKEEEHVAVIAVTVKGEKEGKSV